MVFHPEAFALDDYGIRMMEEAVEDGGGEGGVVIEDGRPVFEGFIGGEDDGTAFITLADDLEEEVCAVLVNGKVSDLVQDQGGGREIFFEFWFEAMSGLRSQEGIDQVHGAGEKGGVTGQACGIAQSGG